MFYFFAAYVGRPLLLRPDNFFIISVLSKHINGRQVSSAGKKYKSKTGDSITR